MADRLDKLVLQITSDSTQLKRDLSGVNQNIDQFSQRASRSLNAFKSAAIAAFGVFSVSQVAGVVNGYIEQARSLDAYSKALGINVEQLQAWQFAAQDVNIQGEKVADIFKDVSEKIGDAFANNAGEAVEALDRLGLSAADLARLSPDQQLLAIARELDNLGTQGEKVQVLESLASDASLLLPLLDDNAVKFRELSGELQNFGTVLDQDAIDKSKELDREMRKLSASAESLKIEILSGLVPALGQYAEAINERGVLGGIGAVLFTDDFANDAAKLRNAREELELLETRLSNVPENSQIWDFYLGKIEKVKTEIAGIETRIFAGDTDIPGYRLPDKPPGGGDRGSATPPPVSTPSPSASVSDPFKDFDEMVKRSGEAVSSENAEYQRWVESMEQAAQALRETINPMEAVESELTKIERLKEGGFIGWDTYAEAVFNAMEGIESRTEEATEEMSVFAEQAARNMQDSLADFLFDPFDEGLEGMLQGFSDTLRRMAAETAAADIFESIGGTEGVGSFLGDIIGGLNIPGFADGTSFAPGGLAVVGERGPELVNLPRGSQVIPNDRAGGDNISISVPVTIYGSPSEKDRRSATQIGNDVGRQIQRSMRRNG